MKDVVYCVTVEICRWISLNQKKWLSLRHPNQVVRWLLDMRTYEITCWSLLIYTVQLKHQKKNLYIYIFSATFQQWICVHRVIARNIFCLVLDLLENNTRPAHVDLMKQKWCLYFWVNMVAPHARQSQEPNKTFTASGNKPINKKT